MPNIPSVQVTSSFAKGNMQVVSDAANWATSVFAVDVGFLEARDWDVESGR